MKKYIALLRGINVGGKNKLSMTDLKKAFEENDFKDVVTYINSGNIMFQTPINDELELKRKCEWIIKNNFQLEILVAIISAENLSDALSNAPLWWDADKNSKHNAIFVIPPATIPQIIEQAQLLKPEYEQVGFHGQIIFWSAPIETFSKTRLTKFVQKNSYNHITIRNANTTKRLLQMTEGQQANH
jgi:uncharacterized protein (DUF1697 family)